MGSIPNLNFQIENSSSKSLVSLLTIFRCLSLSVTNLFVFMFFISELVQSSWAMGNIFLQFIYSHYHPGINNFFSKISIIEFILSNNFLDNLKFVKWKVTRHKLFNQLIISILF